MITIARPALGDEEKKAVVDVIESGIIACGAVTSAFEQEFSAYSGNKHGIATTSGTTALEVALRAIGIKTGDKVLTTPFSFIASTNAIVYVGAIPVFADIDPRTFNISPESIDKALTRNPDIKALMIVHLFGQACDMDQIIPLVRKHNLLLIEDCAQAHGAKWNGKIAGSFGDVAAFSFYPTKNMTTSEGGMVVTNNDATAESARLLINHGMKVRYHHETIGYNYRMTNISAAIGLCQLNKLDGFNKRRTENARLYNEGLIHKLVEKPYSPLEADHVYHQYTLQVEAGYRDAFVKYLETNGIGYGVFYPLSIPEQTCYASMGFQQDFAVTNVVKKRVVSIPVHPLLSENDIQKVISVINQFQGES